VGVKELGEVGGGAGVGGSGTGVGAGVGGTGAGVGATVLLIVVRQGLVAATQCGWTVRFLHIPSSVVFRVSN